MLLRLALSVLALVGLGMWQQESYLSFLVNFFPSSLAAWNCLYWFSQWHYFLGLHWCCTWSHIWLCLPSSSRQLHWIYRWNCCTYRHSMGRCFPHWHHASESAFSCVDKWQFNCTLCKICHVRIVISWFLHCWINAFYLVITSNLCMLRLAGYLLKSLLHHLKCICPTRPDRSSYDGSQLYSLEMGLSLPELYQ